MENLLQFATCWDMVEVGYRFNLLFVEITFESSEHTIVSHLRCVGDEGENGVINIIIDGLEDRVEQLLAQSFAFLIDVAVGATAEIDAFEGAGCKGLWCENLLQ